MSSKNIFSFARLFAFQYLYRLKALNSKIELSEELVNEIKVTIEEKDEESDQINFDSNGFEIGKTLIENLSKNEESIRELVNSNLHKKNIDKLS